jgi:hypothetical protein
MTFSRFEARGPKEIEIFNKEVRIRRKASAYFKAFISKSLLRQNYKGFSVIFSSSVVDMGNFNWIEIFRVSEG